MVKDVKIKGIKMYDFDGSKKERVIQIGNEKLKRRIKNVGEGSVRKEQKDDVKGRKI